MNDEQQFSIIYLYFKIVVWREGGRLLRKKLAPEWWKRAIVFCHVIFILNLNLVDWVVR